MFGYVRPQLPELKLREYQYYRGVYCGLCRAQGRCTGQCSRMTLSYDYVFFTLLRMALENGNPSDEKEDSTVRFEPRRCLPHPLRKRLSLREGRVTRHAALCAALLNYHKLCDDRADEAPFSAAWWRAKLLYLPLRRMYRRAARQEAALAEALREAMAHFTKVEQSAAGSVDAPADAFGEVTAHLLAYGLPDRAATVARHLGKHLGKWLYFADAVDDYDEDVKKDRYNPLRALGKDAPLTDEQRKQMATAMAAELMYMDDALALLDIDPAVCGSDLQPLLRHMLRVALPSLTAALAGGNYHVPRRGARIGTEAMMLGGTAADKNRSESEQA